MPASPAWSDPAAFVEHASWVRGLASRLARDADEADELEQETWLAFLRAPLAGIRSPRRFLGGILRHRFRATRRAEARRVEREELAARAGRVTEGPAGEALEKAELARALVDLVLELEEPYRSAILLRYVDELSPRAIAERLQVPHKTIEARLARGLARLRERWRARHGDDGRRSLAGLAILARAWPSASSAAPVSPALSAGTSGLSTSIGVLLVNTKLVLALVAAVAGGGIFWLWSSRSPELAERASVAAHDVARPGELAPPAEDPALPAPEAAASRAAFTGGEAPERGPAPEALAKESVATIHGRVLDPEARPVAGVPLVLDPQSRSLEIVPSDEGDAGKTGPPRTVSLADGSFELAVQPYGDLRSADPALETLVAARLQGRSDHELLVVVAPHRELAGRVVDESGRPLARARVRVELPPGFMARFSTVLDTALNREWTTTSDEDGRFELGRVAIVAGARVVASLDGFLPASIEAPGGEALDLALVLARPEARGHVLAGHVVDPERAPAAGAWVALGGRIVLADERGEFRLEVDAESEAREVVALQRGFLPARFEAENDPATGAPLFPAWIELVLGGPPLALGGRVADERGAPRADLTVWIADPTDFGEFEDETEARTEFLLAQGASSPGEFGQAGWSAARTDADGRFVVPGLLERSYELVLYDEERVERFAAGRFEAGRTDLELVFPRGTLEPLKVRLLSSAGAPLAGVHAFLEGETYGGVWKQAAWLQSDAEGRLHFPEVGNGGISLLLRGEAIVPLWHFFGARPEGEAEIVLALRCNAKIELADPARADAIRVLDGEEQPLDLYEIGATGITYVRQLPLVEGRSVTFGVSETARTLVLEKGGTEVERMPLRLLAERLNVLTP